MEVNWPADSMIPSDSTFRLFYKNVWRPGLVRLLGHNQLSIDRTELISIANKHLEYGNRDTYQPATPIGPKPMPPELQLKNRPLSDPKPFVCELSDVELVGPPAVPITNRGKFVVEATEGSTGLLADSILSVLRSRQLPLYRNSGFHRTRPLVSLVGFWCNGFYHWFADYLPQVRGIERYAEETGTYPDVFIPTNGPAWQRDSLEYVGVPSERIIPWDGNRVRLSSFVVPSIPRYTELDSPDWGYSPSPGGLRWVANRLREAVDADLGRDQRVLVTRRDASTRRIKNEEEVLETLAPYGFNPVTLSKLPLRKQIELFAQADIVVAPHGAGLINSIYSNNLTILELFGEYVNACYYCLAGGLDFTYQYERCLDIDGDLHVDTNSLETAVKDLI